MMQNDLELGIATPNRRAEPGRQQFVLAVFRNPCGLNDAICNLLSCGFCDGQILLVSDRSIGHQIGAFASEGKVRVEDGRLDGSINGDDPARLPAERSSPFSLLWERMPARPDREDMSIPSRIYHELARHLAEGGAVMIIRLERAEQQRSVARILLDCNCEVVLTHEVAVRNN
jgi:hypothetical protein